MSGVLAAMVGGVTGSVFLITVADASPTEYGYDVSVSPSGAISPSTTLLSTGTLRAIQSRIGSSDFTIAMNQSGAGGQSFFSTVKVMTTAGAVRTYLSSAATFTTPGGVHTWTWGTGSSPVWTAAGTKSVIFSQ